MEYAEIIHLRKWCQMDIFITYVPFTLSANTLWFRLDGRTLKQPKTFGSFLTSCHDHFILDCTCRRSYLLVQDALPQLCRSHFIKIAGIFHALVWIVGKHHRTDCVISHLYLSRKHSWYPNRKTLTKHSFVYVSYLRGSIRQSNNY